MATTQDATAYRPMVFINIPVASLAPAVDFYKAIGFEQNKEFSDASASMMMLPFPQLPGATPINVMLLVHDRFKGFTWHLDSRFKRSVFTDSHRAAPLTHAAYSRARLASRHPEPVALLT